MTDAINRMKLDRARDFGEIYPPCNGAYFTQDGLHFDAEGAIVEALLTQADIERLEAVVFAREKQAEAAAAMAAAAALGAPVTMPAQLAAGGQPQGGQDIDLLAWASGAAKYPFFSVRDYAKKTHAIAATNREGLIRQLVISGILPESVL